MKVFYCSKKALVIIGIALIFVILAIVFMSPTKDNLASTFNTQKLVPIYSVEKKEKVIAISFDAAWGDEYTQQILDILEEEDIKTTFFLVSMWIEKYPDQVKAIVDAGHELGNHSDSHPDMAKLSREDISKELSITHEKLKEFTGEDAFLFRPPFGSYNNDVITVAEELNYYTIQWDVDSLDWKNEGAEQIINRVVSNVQPGSIVLFHNNAEYTTEALPSIIKELKEQEYSIVPISELIYKENFTLDNSGKQIPKPTEEQ